MKITIAFLFYKLFLISTYSLEESITLNCHNQNFLSQEIRLDINETASESPLLRYRHLQGQDYCILKRDVHLQFKPINPYDDNCYLINKSRPQTKRKLIKMTVSESLKLNKRGYLKVKIDNSFAEYGPDALTSFIYCQ